MRLRRTPVTTLLVAALVLTPLTVVPAGAAPEAPIAATATAPAPAATTPLIEGELAVGQTVTAVSADWPEGTVLSYQWLADGAPVPGATTDRLALSSALAGALVEVAVTGQLPEQEPTTLASSSNRRVATTGTPTVSGTTMVGATLKAASGTWTDGTTFTYQWLADGTPIAGATGSSLVLGAAQGGLGIAVAVTGSKSGYQTLTRTSAATALRVMQWSVPTIAGTVAYGSTLTVKPGTWTDGVTRTYQWYANGAAVSGATNNTLKLGSTLKGKKITVKVTGRKAGHTAVAKVSAATGKVATAPVPKVSGSAIAGSTLTATAGTWTAGTTLSYRWYADGVAISGATGRTFKVGSALRDKKLQVKVTGRRSGYATVTKASASTLRVQTAPTPTVSGTPRVTYTLTAKRGTWSAGTTFGYQWYANGRAISGATKSTLTLSPSRIGQKITVKVTGRKSGYPSVSRTSRATTAVTYPSRTTPVSSWNCPSWAPIKGNANSGIYHVPSGSFYTRTKPEDCFRTEAAAVAAGYRKSKV